MNKFLIDREVYSGKIDHALSFDQRANASKLAIAWQITFAERALKTCIDNFALRLVFCMQRVSMGEAEFFLITDAHLLPAEDKHGIWLATHHPHLQEQRRIVMLGTTINGQKPFLHVEGHTPVMYMANWRPDGCLDEGWALLGVEPRA